VTLRRDAGLALEESERRWRKAFDSAPVPMVEVDLDGRYLKVNGAMCNSSAAQLVQFAILRRPTKLVH
jgi:PAS domain-containing protein